MTIPIVREKDVLAACLAYLKTRKVLAWRQNTGAMSKPNPDLNGRQRFVRFGFPGMPDILAVLPGGRLLGIETKSSVGRVTDLQLACMKNFLAAGAAYIIVFDVKELVDWLEPVLLRTLQCSTP